MKHLEVLKLLTALSNAKNILGDMREYGDFDVVELLEIKYEKFYIEMSKK